jgi:hypothetical protein
MNNTFKKEVFRETFMIKIKDFKNRMIKATLALTMIVGTNSLLFTNVYAEGNEGGDN